MARSSILSVLGLALGLSTVAAVVPATTHACGHGAGAACARGAGPGEQAGWSGYQPASAALTSAYVELDPILFGLSGFGVQAGVRPYGYLEIGGGAFGLDVPDFALDEGWSRTIRGGNLMAGIHCGPRGGLSVGLATLVYQSEWSHVDGNNEQVATRTELAIAPFLSVQWFPFRRAGLYLRPVAMLGVVAGRFGDEPVIAGHTADESRLFHHLGLHVGWQFGGNVAPATASPGPAAAPPASPGA